MKALIERFFGGNPPATIPLSPKEHEDVPVQTAHPNGHFYSPVVDPDSIEAQSARIWPEDPEVLGIDFNEASHRQILGSYFPKFLPEYDYPETVEDSDVLEQFYTRNSQFSWLDSRSMFVLLRAWQPRRLIEVGSGYSTLLAADVKRRFLDDRLDITCIEPYPRPFLRHGFSGLNRLVEKKVQDVPLSEFAQLEAGDILFIDSSHVAKTGSDVNFLYFEVLPRLNPGVRIHVHDIFLPSDYPHDWVVTENRSWNEQYLLRALLMYSTAFEVTFSCSHAYWRHRELLKEALAYPDGRAFGGGSIWLVRR
ncbi:class I SAM-dependent methyltransferase [Dokdonella immobilis]|uniref:class I SAM-dependent methyltransferase n=1 Tax=Dokdonella immobilis TaxID=578942 RepID=UPI001113E006|nr:class I SAM-dependent methyltransferase [Dokdonella immobilis]